MKRPVLAVVIAVLTAFGLPRSEAALAIEVGTYTFPPGSNVFEVPIRVTGGDLVTDMAGAIQIGDGGPLVGGKAGPKITAVSYVGSIWTNAPGGFTSLATVTLPAEICDPSVFVKVTGQRVPASGLLFTLTIDATGFTPGVHDLMLTGVGPAASPFSTQFQNSGTNVAVTIVNGRLYLGTNAPVLAPHLQLTRTNSIHMRLSFFGETGRNYRIQWGTTLTTNWTELPLTLTGEGALLSWIDDGNLTGLAPGLAPRRFYRVRLTD